MAEERDGAVHAFEAGVGETERDRVRDLLAVCVEGQGGSDERLKLAHARGVDPFVEQAHRLCVVAGEVHRAQLVEQQPPEVDVAVGLGELIEDRLVAVAQSIASAAQREPRALQSRRAVRVGLPQVLPLGAA